MSRSQEERYQKWVKETHNQYLENKTHHQSVETVKCLDAFLRKNELDNFVRSVGRQDSTINLLHEFRVQIVLAFKMSQI